MDITIYTTPTCPYCVMVKNYLRGKKIEFEDIDVSQDRNKAEEMIKISGQMSVPVIVIDKKNLPADRQIITGFDQAQIESALKLNE